MLSELVLWAQLVAALGSISLDSLSVTGAPFDLTPEWREVTLREALTAQTGNPRLIIYLRDLDGLGLKRSAIVQQLPQVMPLTAIEAEVINRNGKPFQLHATGYTFFHGLPGVVLEEDSVPKGETFYKLQVRSRVPLKGATLVWLDSYGRSRPEY